MESQNLRPPQQDVHGSADPVDLESIFSHPDGLYTARCLVGAFVKSAVESAQRSAAKEIQHWSGEEEDNSIMSGPSIPSHLQEPGVLETLLAFKGAEMSWSNSDGDVVEADRRGFATPGEGSSDDINPPRTLLSEMRTTSQSTTDSGSSSGAQNQQPPVTSSTSSTSSTSTSLQQPLEDSITSAAYALSSLSSLANTHTSSSLNSTTTTMAPHQPQSQSTSHPQPQLQHQPVQPQSRSVPSIIPSIEPQSCTALAPNRQTPDITSQSLVSSSASTPSPMDGANDSAKKRKLVGEHGAAAKKQKIDGLAKVKRVTKPKPEKQTAGSELPDTLWMQILEYAPPRFLGKMRLVSRRFKNLVDEFDSIYVNCRLANFGNDMPAPPEGITERQYNNLLQGKGCQNPECEDKLTTRTHWSWYKRWCMSCWKEKIVRDDRLQKAHAHTYVRPTLANILECIPVGMQDSFVKPHDFVVEDGSPRQRGAPRLYKIYLKEDVTEILREYEALTPPPYQEDPNHTPEQKAAAQAAHQELMDQLPDKRNEFIATRKAKNDEHMAKVIKIEQGIKSRREVIREPNSENRNARKLLFSRRAAEDLPHIPEDFVKRCEPFKAATRVFRDPGSERGWQLLKPKIEKAFKADPNARGRQNQIKAAANGESDTESSYTSAASPRCGFDGADDLPDHGSHFQMMSSQYHTSQSHGRQGPTSVTNQMLIHPQINSAAQTSFMRRSNSANNALGPINLPMNGIAFPYAHYMTPSLERSFSGESGYGVHRSSGNNGTGGFQVSSANSVTNQSSTSSENPRPNSGSAPHRLMATGGSSSSNDGLATNGSLASGRIMVGGGNSGHNRIMMPGNNSGSNVSIASHRDAESSDGMANNESRRSDGHRAINPGTAVDRFTMSGSNSGTGNFPFTSTMSLMTDAHMMSNRHSMANSHSFMGESSMSGSYNTNFTNSSHPTDRLSIQHLITQPSSNGRSTNSYDDFSRTFR